MNYALKITEKYDELTDECYRSDELEPEIELTKDLNDYIQESSTAAYRRAQEFINGKLSQMPTTYKLECLFDQMKLEEYKKFEKEFIEILKGGGL